ncbi:MAG: hypothetical protein ACI4CT_06250 [Lachnospiraceae bacterium]
MQNANIITSTLLSLVLAIGSLTGCSSNSSSDEMPINDTPHTMEEGTFGIVTSIDQDVITLDMGDMRVVGERHDDSDRPERPPEPDDLSKDKKKGSSSQKPPGDALPFEKNGETKTIRIDDSVRIMLHSGPGFRTEGTLEDITVNSILNLVYDDDTLTEINVQMPHD